jgi:hypothetical protein
MRREREKEQTGERETGREVFVMGHDGCCVFVVVVVVVVFCHCRSCRHEAFSLASSEKNLEIACNPPTRMVRRTSHVTPMLVLPKQSKLLFFESQHSKVNCHFGPVSQAKSM